MIKNRFRNGVVLLLVFLGLVSCNLPTTETPQSVATTTFVMVTSDPNASPTPTPFQAPTPTPSPYVEVEGEIRFSAEKTEIELSYFPAARAPGTEKTDKITWVLLVNNLVTECSGEEKEGTHSCEGPGTSDPNSISLYIDGQAVSLSPEEGKFTFDVIVSR